MDHLHLASTEDLLAELRRRRDGIDRAISDHGAIDEPARQILLAVADAFGCPVTRLFRRDRTQGVTIPRQAAMVLLRTHGALTFTQIGAIFSLDHGTVIHARDTQPGRMIDPGYAAKFRAAQTACETAMMAKPF
jgi:hypothetical protein